MSLALEGLLELAHRFGRPSHQARPISFRFQQALQIGTQGLILVGGPLPPTTFPAHPTSWLIERSCLHFAHPLTDRLRATWLIPPGLCRHIQPPLSLIEHS